MQFRWRDTCGAGSGSVKRSLLLIGTLLVLASLSPSPTSAQSGADIANRMLAAYEQRAEGVDNYTVVQDVLGFETVTYYQKQTVDGRVVFKLVRSSANGVDIDEPSGAGVDEIYLMGDELGQRAQYVGRETVDDYDVYVLDVGDLSDTDFGRNVTPDAAFSPTSGRIYVDVDTYAPRRMELKGEMTRDGEPVPITLTIDMGDFREVEHLLLPYHTVITMEGIGAAIDESTRAQFEQMQQELEKMPPEQRQMVESMMAGQLERFRALMENQDAPMVIEILVQEVKVNEGPPS